jgi:hypothetical protein
VGLAKMGVKYDVLDEIDRLAIQVAVTESISAMDAETVSDTLYS